jgi:hypothetical protein
LIVPSLILSLMARKAVPVLALCLPGVVALQPALRLPSAMTVRISQWNPDRLFIAFTVVPLFEKYSAAASAYFESGLSKRLQGPAHQEGSGRDRIPASLLSGPWLLPELAPNRTPGTRPERGTTHTAGRGTRGAA